MPIRVEHGVELDPDVLHGDQEPATGHVPVVLKEYHLRPTGVAPATPQNHPFHQRIRWTLSLPPDQAKAQVAQRVRVSRVQVEKEG